MPRQIPQSETKRPTHAEIEDRLLMTIQLIGKGLHDGQIKKQLAAYYKVSPKTIALYLHRARVRMRAELARPKEERQADSLAFYRNMRQNALTDMAKLKAAERIDKIEGNEAKQEVELSGGLSSIPLAINIVTPPSANSQETH